MSDVITLAITLAAMLALAWRLTLGPLVAAAVFVCPQASAALQRSPGHGAERRDATTMTERFNVAGALLVELFGARREATSSGERAGRCATSRDRSAMYRRVSTSPSASSAHRRQAAVYGLGGDLGDQRDVEARHARRPGRPTYSALRAAHRPHPARVDC